MTDKVTVEELIKMGVSQDTRAFYKYEAVIVARALEVAIRGLRNIRRAAKAKEAEPLLALVDASSVRRSCDLLLREIGVRDE